MNLATEVQASSNQPEEPLAVELRGVTKVFRPRRREPVTALESVDLRIKSGALTAIVGPSGCGKSTILRILAGLIPVDDGQVQTGGHDLRTAMVFQKPLLLEWKSVIDNVLLPAQIQGGVNQATRNRARDLINLMGLSQFENSLPRELSGGMQQRAGIARALLIQPEVLLLDEPFGSLDALTREQLNLELSGLLERSRGEMTVVLVTHDIPEAVFLSDEVAVMSARPGRVLSVVDVGIPRPRNASTQLSTDVAEVAREVHRLLQPVLDADRGEMKHDAPN